MPIFLLPLLGKIAEKFLPSFINASVQLWIQAKIQKNRPEIVQNKEAQLMQQDQDTFNQLTAKAQAGDKEAQRKLRARESE